MDRFPPGVEAAIAEVFPSDDPLDDPDFNATDYINQVKEGSLSEIEAKLLQYSRYLENWYLSRAKRIWI